MGSQTPDISAIRALVAKARARLRMQYALEGATTGVVLAAAWALCSVYAVRAYMVSPAAGVQLLLASLLFVVAGAIIGATRALDDEELARKIDQASRLSDRLSTAVAFDRVLKAPIGAGIHDEDSRELMRAAMRDAVKAAPRADIAAATPFKRPRDLKAAGAFAAVAAIATGLGLPSREPRIRDAAPARACFGAPVAISGDYLCGPNASGAAECTRAGQRIVLAASGHEITPDAWTGSRIDVTIPDDEPPGPTLLVVFDDARARDGLPPVLGLARLDVVDCAQEKASRDGVVLDDDDLSYTKDLLEELRQTAQRDQIPELQAYVDRVEEALAQAERGELSKEELLEELKKAQEALEQGTEPDQKEVDQDLADTGKELEKNELTKELGKALEQGDLEKAKQEMEKLAEKMDKGELTEKQKQELAKAMEKAAKAYQKKDEQRQKDQQSKIDKAQKELRQLQKQKDEEQDPKKKEELERRLEKKKRELEQLNKDKQKKDESEQRRALKRLHKDMEDAAKDLQKKSDDQEQDQQNQKSASEKMKDAAGETGRVDRDKRKTATTKKVASQMDDLREAMRRAKKRGGKGPKNPFGKNGKQSDFERRARGQKGQKGAWKPGQGQKGGKGQGQNGGQGQGDPQQSDTYGDGHDPNLTGDSTAKTGDTKDEDAQGVQGKGPSRRETILSAAQKGFASKGYEKVYADYKRVVEEVMRSEKVPSSYKYYIKKYFTKIKPHSMD